MKEGGGLVGGTCEHCEDRAPSGPRQDSVRTLSGLCQDSVRTLSGLSGQLRELHKPGSLSNMRFLLDGQRIDEAKTPGEMGMEDGEVIDAEIVT